MAIEGELMEVEFPGEVELGGAGEATLAWELAGVGAAAAAVAAVLGLLSVLICAILCCMNLLACTLRWFCWSRRFFLILAHTGTGHLSTLQVLAWEMQRRTNCLQTVHWFHFPVSMSLHSLVCVNTLFILIQLGCLQRTS